MNNTPFEVIPLDDPKFLEAQRRRRLSEMVIELHDIAREENSLELRKVADKLSDAIYAVCQRVNELEEK